MAFVVNVLPKEYSYHPYLNAFIACCDAINLVGVELDWQRMMSDPYRRYSCLGGLSPLEVFNAMLNYIGIECRSRSVKAAVYSLEYESKERMEEYSQYFNAIMAVCNRAIVLRVDAYYKKEIAHHISLEEATRDIERLLTNMRNNSLFDDLPGYIIKTEYGIDKGIHFHLTFFFSGRERRPASHVHHARLIGDYWEKVITKGRGDYWNCNDHAHNFEKLNRRAIGLIHWSDQMARDNVIEHVIGYACKPEQIFKLKSGQIFKMIRRGKFPVIPERQLGRPRQL